ncbi:heat-inducible transcriptional repressor HrcA [Sulfuriflexus sp.]|uniref:heat-inducible transcriptional repressor HrcA n=1 Tax=Sulfuriflexus sp. TaxID=2015443 RepID=UPI0028CC0E7C|nr:heat-inducible transcriptional repressor HrcA [Sulfuriflexus sp.]MDT8404835.1 heat-inducible transcriptional repressor HrcA [Sulfuriflexus sp.]
MANVGPLNERAQHLLRVLIDRYIEDGKPIGSRTLSREARLDLSPATIRNVMADLEDLGLIAAPHTSAGRVPTVKGYRFFVDTLLSLKPLDSHEVDSLQQRLSVGNNEQGLIASVSDMLSGITHLAGVVTMPRREANAWQHVEFLPLSDNRVLTVLVLNDQQVQNKIFTTDKAYSPAELQQAANYLNQTFSGKSFQQVRDQLLREMQDAKIRMDQMMLAAMEMAGKVCDEDKPYEEDYVLAGQTNLIGMAALSDMDRLRELFEAFNAKRDILHILDQSQRAEGVQIFIGEESGYRPLDECSVITSPYQVDGQVAGVLGVIGPTRMAYERVIPIVDITAKLLGAALNPRS